MTTSRCDAIVVADLEYTSVSAPKPDAIGLEVGLAGSSLFSIDATADGRITINFDDVDNAIFNLNEFRAVVASCEQELLAWRTNMTSDDIVEDDDRVER